MPQFPERADRVEKVPASVFERFREKMKEKGSYLIRLHIGDTYLHPRYSLPISDEFIKKRPFFNRYCNTFGVERFCRVLRKKLQEDNGFSISEGNILTTNGATNALSASVLSLMNPGEEILVLTPCWPFFPGMVKMADAQVVEVPFYTELYQNSELAIEDYLQKYLTSRTVALYLNTPNNPSGKVLNQGQLQQLADFAKKNKLWIISDEAYDGLVFEGHDHICIATLPRLFEQTISIFTFSKSFMFAGLRLGYVVADEKVIEVINKTMVHQLYSPSTLSQYMMVQPVLDRHSWIPALCQEYQEMRDMIIENLEFPVRPPEGTYFLFFSIADMLNGRDYWDVIDDLLEEGVSVAPGEDFGKGYENYIRICFTGEPPERLMSATERINRVLVQQ